MAKYSREDKLRIMTNFVLTDGWALMKSEIEQQLAHNKGRIDSATDAGDTNRLFASEAYRLALEYVLTLPDKVTKENTAFFDRLYKKVLAVDD